MLSKGFNKEFFESVYKLNEDCGSGSGCGTSEPGPSCGGSGCGLAESLQKMNECGDSYSYDSASIYGCGALGYHHSCEVGRRVRIIIDGSCGGLTEVGRLLGYAD